MDDSTFRIADIFAPKHNDVADLHSGKPLPFAYVVGDQNRVSSIVRKNESLVARRITIVCQNPRHRPRSRYPGLVTERGEPAGLPDSTG